MRRQQKLTPNLSFLNHFLIFSVDNGQRNVEGFRSPDRVIGTQTEIFGIEAVKHNAASKTKPNQRKRQ